MTSRIPLKHSNHQLSYYQITPLRGPDTLRRAKIFSSSQVGVVLADGNRQRHPDELVHIARDLAGIDA
jgi:hypothetical protein